MYAHITALTVRTRQNHHRHMDPRLDCSIMSNAARDMCHEGLESEQPLLEPCRRPALACDDFFSSLNLGVSHRYKKDSVTSGPWLPGSTWVMMAVTGGIGTTNTPSQALEWISTHQIAE